MKKIIIITSVLLVGLVTFLSVVYVLGKPESTPESVDTTNTTSIIPAETENQKDNEVVIPAEAGIKDTATKSTSLTYTETASGALNGYTLLITLGGDGVKLIDMDGNLAHAWELSGSPSLSVYLLPNGKLLTTYKTKSKYFTSDNKTSGVTTGGGIALLDWNSKVLWSYELPNSERYHMHHDVAYMPNGHILAISYERLLKDEALSLGFDETFVSEEGEVWSEAIFEIDPSTSKIVWEWHAIDHLGTTANKLNPSNTAKKNTFTTSADWLHFNAIDYNEELDQIILSSRNQNEIYIIDHNTTTKEAAGNAGDLLFRYGNGILAGQHNAHWIDRASADSNILIFNNGSRKTGHSTIIELDPNSSYTGASIVWQYGDDADEVQFFADHISGVDRLPNGNTLICVGTEGYVFEIDVSDNKVWDYQNTYGKTTPQGTTYELFRAYRYPVSYSGLQF